MTKINYNYMKILLSKYQKSLFYEIFIKNEYSLLDEIISKSNIIFDVWSNIGLFSLYILSLKYNFLVKLEEDFLIIEDNILNLKDFKVHLFEPSIKTFNLSKEILNNFEENLIFNNIWLSNKSGTFEIIIPEIDCQTSLYESFLTKKSSQKFLAQFIKFQDYIHKNNISQIDLLKLDVEWSEFDILLDLEEKYFRKIKVLFLEYHLLNNNFEEKFPKLLEKLRNYFTNVEVKKWEYSDRIGYIICK